MDLIDRQQVLEIKFSNGMVRRGVAYVRVDELVNKLKALPTIQPVATDINVGDTISRQQAIDALQKEINKGIPPFDDTIGAIRCGVRLARNIIEDLPSAQPEPSIPLSWIEEHIEWLKSLDNEFANLAATHISVMVKKWRSEQEGDTA